MSRQTSTRVLVQLWCLLAVAAFANATSVASRIAKHALAANPAATRSVTRTLRQAAQVARAAPVAAERRGLAESDLSMCEYLGDSLSCSFAADHGACARKSGCEWDGSSCDAPFDDEAFSAELISDMESGMDQLTTCALLVDDASACDAEENCEANAACNPTEAFMESIISDPVMAKLMHKTFVCLSIGDANECNSQAMCEVDYFEGSCGISDEAVESIIIDALLECDLDTSIAAGVGAAVPQDVDLCPVAEAQIECMQITTESACNSATKCEWADPDDSDDPHDTKYPCSAKEEHMSPMIEVLEANYAVMLRAYGECRNEYTSESACEGDEECEWNGDDNVCEAKDLKLYRALGNVHPHFARYYQMEAICGSFGQSACGTGDSANKCAWSAASVGGDAECVPTIQTFAEVMSCECSTEVAAAAPTVDTSFADCTVPVIEEWLTTTPAPAIETATASNCENVCEGHGHTRDQCLDVSDGCEWDNGRCWSRVGPNRCVYFTDAVQLLEPSRSTDAVQLVEPSRSAAFQIFNALFAIVTLCAFALISD